jgi:D-serine deaminase-like pyridoxal phosphate-dependent protein
MKKLYAQYSEALSTYNSPCLFVDQEALDKNIQWVLQNANSKKIRIATKSIRSVEILKYIQDCSPNFQGLMTYSLEEALWLKSLGFKDILMGYPTWDKNSLSELAKDPRHITLMVDRIEHLELLENIAKNYHTHFSICVDIDLSMDLPGLRFGVYRSKINTQSAVKKFLHQMRNSPHLKLIGVMGYEAQIAGVMDDSSKLIQALKKLSLSQLQKRREQFVTLIQKAGHNLEIINGGGTGSLKHTVKESVVTEVTVGSAFYAPVLFDHYIDFKLTPAMFFSSPIVRRPTDQIFTVLGGGYIASGSTDSIKQPNPYLPTGLSLIKHEGAGEVQTPLKNLSKTKLSIGDLVFFRHAKAAEVCERFNQILILRKNLIENSVNTYRGEGKCFL